MSVSIERLDKTDLRETIELCVQCFGEDWRKIAEVDFPESLGTYPYKPNVFVAKEAGKIIGMSVITPVFLTPDTYSITWLCVDEAHRRKGIAADLIQECESFVMSDLIMFDKAMVILASAVDSKYYEGLGYADKFITHRDDPFMVKYLNK